VIAGLVVAWILYSFKAYRTAIAFSLLPLLDVAAFAVLFVVEG